MQNVVSLLASGESIKIDNTLVSNVNSLSFVLENNKRYEDSISVYNARELKMEGKVYSDNNRVIIKNREINDKIKKISFTIDTTDMEDGSKIEGNISVIVDVGSINIPFEYTISENENKKKIRELNTIIDYYNYFMEEPKMAFELFQTDEFVESKLLNDELSYTIYEALKKSSSKSVACIEFFKAFDLDIVDCFLGIDDKIVEHYKNDTIGDIDIVDFKGNKVYEKLLREEYLRQEEKENDVQVKDAMYYLDKIRDKDFLDNIAIMCVRNNFTNPIAFKAYEIAANMGANINGIFDKLLLSIPKEYDKKLPMYIYKFYNENKTYTFESKIRLYENIVKVFNETDDIYKLYKEEINNYALSQIYQNKITESLVTIYDGVLNKDIINSDNYNNILFLLRSYKLKFKNKNIRNVIIKYKEIENETSYEVINNISYVPIFFDSYEMLFEDVYGVRYLNQDYEMKPLFDKKELENYIIDNYKNKNIIDMTKLIKLKNAVKFDNDYEVDEAIDLIEKLNATHIVKENFSKKIVDYFFRKVENNDTFNNNHFKRLKEIDIKILNDVEKKEYMKVLLFLKDYKTMYESIIRFSNDISNDEDIEELFLQMINLNMITNKFEFQNEVLSYLKKNNTNAGLLGYMAEEYEGSLNNYILIFRFAKNLNLNLSNLSKRILELMFITDETEDIDEVYQSYDVYDTDDKTIKMAYLTKKTIEYFLDEKHVNQYVFESLTNYLFNNIDNIQNIPIIYIFAITKYISSLQNLTNNELRRILVRSMEFLLEKDYVFAYFKNINRHLKMPLNIMNKEYIEYHANKDFVPKVIINLKDNTYKQEFEMTKMYKNIYIKKVTVFKNEVVNYEIVNSDDLSAGILKRGTLTYDENYELEYPKKTKMKSTYDYINDAIENLDKNNIEKLKKLVIEMTIKQEVSEKLFNIS